MAINESKCNVLEKSSNKVAVQTTNDSSIVSKCSMVKTGYFEDPFINEFVTKFYKRTSLINRGYYVRAKAVENAVFTWLDFILQTVHPQELPQIISLGAGFDTLFFRINNSKFKNKFKVCELDYIDVVKRKASIIKSSHILLKEFTSINENFAKGLVLDSIYYALVGIDLKNINNFEINFNSATLLLSECAITYMTEKDSSNLIRWASKFEKCVFLTYEQICPDDGFGQVMVNHFKSTGSPLLSVHLYKTIEMQKKRYLDRGFTVCDVTDMNSFHQSLDETELKRIEDLELFEEFEEFHQKCGHYVLIEASRGLQHEKSIANSVEKFIENTILLNQTVKISAEHSIENVNRFGHRSVVLNGKYIITIGGFGAPEKENHRRLKSIVISELATKKNFVINLVTAELQDGVMFHSLTSLDDETVMFFGGRTSPIHGLNSVYFIKFNDAEACEPVFEKISTSGEYPEARWRHTATSAIIEGQLKVLIFGGKSAFKRAMNDCYCFDVKNINWTKILKKNSDDVWPPALHSHSVCSWRNKMVISGGLNEFAKPTNEIYLLDYTDLTWKCIMTSELLFPRYSHTSHVWQDQLILVGGVSTAINVPGIAIIDLNTFAVQEFSLPILPNPFMLSKHSSVVIPETETLFILGGGGNCFSFGTHINQSTMAIKLEDLTSELNTITEFNVKKSSDAFDIFINIRMHFKK